MPPLAKVDWKAALLKLKVEEHVDLPLDVKYIGGMTRWVRKTHPNRRFVSRTIAGGVRVWRNK